MSFLRLGYFIPKWSFRPLYHLWHIRFGGSNQIFLSFYKVRVGKHLFPSKKYFSITNYIFRPHSLDQIFFSCKLQFLPGIDRNICFYCINELDNEYFTCLPNFNVTSHWELVFQRGRLF